jgi:hypothetical protein
MGTSLTVGEFFSQAAPLTVATALVAFMCSRKVIESWFARIGWSLVLGTLATLLMYWWGAGTLHGTGQLWDNIPSGIAGTFSVALRFLGLYYLIAGPWMVLGCLVVGIIVGVGLDRITR